MNLTKLLLAAGLSLPATAIAQDAPPPRMLFGGWLYAPYTTCVPGQPQCVVRVPAGGVNLRQWQDGPTVIALVNGTPLVPYTGSGAWVFVGVLCPLAITGLWSGTTPGVPLYACAG